PSSNARRAAPNRGTWGASIAHGPRRSDCGAHGRSHDLRRNRGRPMGIADAFAALAAPMIGRKTTLPRELLDRYPELATARWRRGGLPVRIGGWCLGQRAVSAITLWHTIWLDTESSPSEELLLHEIRHVA